MSDSNVRTGTVAFILRFARYVLISLIICSQMRGRSLQYLFDAGMISSPDDNGMLTQTGKVMVY